MKWFYHPSCDKRYLVVGEVLRGTIHSTGRWTFWCKTAHHWHHGKEPNIDLAKTKVENLLNGK